jgi:peptidyl-prolyl cis-trans isomerase C
VKASLRSAICSLACMAALAALAAGCRDRPAPPPMEVPVAELLPVSGEGPTLVIAQGEYRAARARLRFQRAESLYAKRLPDRLKDHVLDSLITDRLVAEEAERLQVRASTAAVARELAAVRAAYREGELQGLLVDTYQTEADLARSVETRLVRRALLEREAFGAVKVSDAEVEAGVQALPDADKKVPERVHAAQIVLPTEEEALTVVRALARKDADFGALARAASIAPEASQGGDLGWFGRGEMPAVFDEACWPLQPGEVSHVVPSQFGFHVCKVLERAPERARTLEELRPGVRARLLTEKRREAEAQYLGRLRARYQVVRHEPPPATE